MISFLIFEMFEHFLCFFPHSLGWCLNQSFCLPIPKFQNPIAAGELTGQVLCAGFLRSVWITSKTQCQDSVCTGLTCEGCEPLYSNSTCHWCEVAGYYLLFIYYAIILLFYYFIILLFLFFFFFFHIGLAKGCFGPSFDNFCDALGGHKDPAVCPAPALNDTCEGTLNCTSCLANNCSFCDFSDLPNNAGALSFCISCMVEFFFVSVLTYFLCFNLFFFFIS
jgi:hypothetical protein